MIILLHSVQLAENLGAVARVMGNFGLSQLRLITPCADVFDMKAVATAAGAEHILHKATLYNSLQKATHDLHTLIGTCADIRTGIRAYTTPENIFNDPIPLQNIGILFGPERTGLSQEDLSYCKATLQIPVDASFSSLNLSHAVGIVCYAYFKSKKHAHNHLHTGETTVATQGEKNHFFHTLEQMLDEVGYFRVDSKKPLMRQNLRNFFSRNDITTQEIRTLLGVFRALRHPRKGIS